MMRHILSDPRPCMAEVIASSLDQLWQSCRVTQDVATERMLDSLQEVRLNYYVNQYTEATSSASVWLIAAYPFAGLQVTVTHRLL